MSCHWWYPPRLHAARGESSMAGYQIQRLRSGDKLDQSFRLRGVHFVRLTVPFIVVYVPYNLAMRALGLDGTSQDPTQVLRNLGMLGLMMLYMLATAPLAQLVVNVTVA